MRRGSLPHALLIAGPEGIGKHTFTTELARTLLCERPLARGTACNACTGCAWYQQGSHPDFRFLEPEQPKESGEAGEGRERRGSAQITVEQVRELADFINLSSHRGGARVVLIEPAESLNPNAANALLKGLEEPPSQTHFLLVTHRWQQLLPTIRSRCQQIMLPLPAAKPALDWLESQSLPDPPLALAHAGGAPLLAAAFEDEYWQARERLLELIGASRFDPLDAANALHDVAPQRIVTLLQKWSYDLAFQKTTGRVRYNPDRAAALARLSARLDMLAIVRFHRSTVQLQRFVHHPLNARLFVEELLLAYAELVRSGGLKDAA